MNERIKELSQRAHQWAIGESKFGYHQCKVGSDYFLALKEQKFAELLVKECISVCENGWQGEFTVCGINQCVSDLKEHFGIEG